MNITNLFGDRQLPSTPQLSQYWSAGFKDVSTWMFALLLSCIMHMYDTLIDYIIYIIYYIYVKLIQLPSQKYKFFLCKVEVTSQLSVLWFYATLLEVQTFSRFTSPMFDTPTSTTAVVICDIGGIEEIAGFSFTILITSINSYQHIHCICIRAHLKFILHKNQQNHSV